MSATTAVAIQVTLASGTLVGVILAAIAFLTGTTAQVAKWLILALLTVACLTFFWIAVPIAWNIFYRKAPAKRRGRHGMRVVRI